MEKTLELKFTTAQNEQVTLTIAKPKENLTDVAIDEAMDAIIAANVLAKGDQLVVAKKSARYVLREVVPVSIS